MTHHEASKVGSMRMLRAVFHFSLFSALVACGGEAVQKPAQSTATVPAAAPAPPAQLDFETRYKASYAAAVEAATAGDLKRAQALLDALVPDAKSKTDADTEFWLHNQLTWVHWAAGDLEGALAEVDAAKDALGRSQLDAPSKTKLALHELWDRAYIELELAHAAADHDALSSKADDARNAYQELAIANDDRDGMAVLEAFFAVRKGDGNHAKMAAKRVDMTKDEDLQDLYVLALALDLGGDAAGAQNARARICSGHVYLMKPLIVRQLARENHACPAP